MSRKGRQKARQSTRSSAPDGWNMLVVGTEEFNKLCASGFMPLKNCPEIQTAANRIADLISSMTIYLMTNSPIGDIRVQNELSRKVDIAPNKYATRKALMYGVVRNMLLDGRGNAILYPKHRNGYLEDLIPLDMEAATIQPEGYGYYVLYRGRRYEPDEILHFVSNPDPQSPWIGRGYDVLLRDIARNLRQAQQTKNAFLSNPAPSVIIRVDGLTEEMDTPQGRDALTEKYFSTLQSGRPLLIPADIAEVAPMKPITINDLAIKDGVSIDKRTAAAIFGLPPFMVGEGNFDRPAYNAMVSMTIMPIARGIEQELTRKLLISEDLFFRLNTRSLMSYSMQEMMVMATSMMDRMAMGRNEARDWLGMQPREDMEELLALENYLPVDRLGDQKKLLEGGDDAANEG